VAEDCAIGILNSPDPSYDPQTDNSLVCQYSLKNYVTGKNENKRFLQKTLGLVEDVDAPLFF
jgi:glycogen synthase